MNRLSYYLKAHTVYNIQSPFMYEYYTKVYSTKSSISKRSKVDCFLDLVRKTISYYGLRSVYFGAGLNDESSITNHCIVNDPRFAECVVLNFEDEQNIHFEEEQNITQIVMVYKPHSSSFAESSWESLQNHAMIRMCLDFYDIGVCFCSSKLSKQCFLIR